MKRSIFNIKDIFVARHEYSTGNCYDNKFISSFDVDDFAGYVLDRLDAKGNPAWNKTSWLYQIEYLDHIPREYARVYLYGVWFVIQPVIRHNAIPV